MPPKKPIWKSLLTLLVVVSVVISLVGLLYIALVDDTDAKQSLTAQEARKAHDVVAERAALEAITDVDPQHVESIERLANIDREEGRFNDAAEHWGQVAVLDPLHATARFEQARNLYASGQFGAVDALLSQLPQTSENPDLQALMAMSKLSIGRVEEAHDILDNMEANFPAHAQTQLLSADRAFIRDQLDQAEAGYIALSKHPELAASAHFGRAQVLLKRGHAEQAVALLSQRPLTQSDSYQLAAAHAKFWTQTGRLEQARATYQYMLKHHGPLPDTIVPWAELIAAQGKSKPLHDLRLKLIGTTTPVLAARHYIDAMQSYIEKTPKRTLQKLVWAENYFGGRDLFRWMALDSALQVGDSERAAAAVNKLRGRSLAALRRGHAADLIAAHAAQWIDQGKLALGQQFAKLSLSLQEDNAAARLVQARHALLSGNELAAANQAKALLNQQLVIPAATEVLARAQLARGDFVTSEQTLRQLIELLPTSSTGPYWLGINLYRQQRYEEAIEQLRLAWQRNQDPRISGALLDVLLQTGDFVAAMTLAEEQIQQPELAAQAVGWAFKAGVLRTQNKITEAISAYREALQLDSDRTVYALAMADMLIDQHQYSAARNVLDRMLQRKPTHQILRFKRAYLAQLEQDVDVAIERYRALLIDHPQWALVMVNLSELLIEQKSSQHEAISLAKWAVELTPKWPQAHWNLAQRAYAVQQNALAEKATRTTLALTPEHTKARELLNDLSEPQR